MSRCLQCGSENRTAAVFCGTCGKTLEEPRATPGDPACKSCGASMPASHRYCDACGTARAETAPSLGSYTPAHLQQRVLVSRSAIEGERKVVTVLFADVAGFSATAERLDPEAVHAIMEGCFERLVRSVHHYEGTVNQFTGDGIMALFGAPIAHEDHAVRALRAALAIRDEIQAYDADVQRRWNVSCRMRLGVNTGTVVVGRIGDNLRMDYTAVGDTTNLAARLQQAATPGAVWVGEATHRLSANEFTWERLELDKLRGREGAVVAYVLTDLKHTVGGRFEDPGIRGLTPLVGREQELKQMEAAWGDARDGKGRVVSVVGEAGLGKTRLLHEFKRIVSSSASSMLCEGSCFDHGNTTSYLPFRELLKTLFRLQSVRSETDAVTRVNRGVEELGLDGSVASAILNVLSYPVADEGFRTLPANLIRERTVKALRAVIAAVAARQPLALVFEDLHWIDQATEEVVSALVDDAPTLSLLLVLVFRPEYMTNWKAQEHHSKIELARLASPSSAEMVRAVLNKAHASLVALARISPQQSSEMIRQLLGAKSVPAALERLVAQTTDGNPLFIEEFVLSLIESGALTGRGEDWILTAAPERLKPPDTLQGLLLARVDRLTDDLKEILKVASVIGRVFTSSVLSEASSRRHGLNAALADLEALELIYRQTDAAPGTYSFKHVLSQQAVYDSILIAKREGYHGQVGRAIESLEPDRLREHCELLAFHYERSSDLDKAVEYLHQANRKAIGISAMADAQDYFERASKLLEHLPNDPRNRQRKLSLVLDQVFVALALFKYREYRALLEQHAALAEALGNPRSLGGFHARVGWCQWAIGDFGAGIETLDRAAQYCKAAGNDDDLGFALMTRAWCELARGEFERALGTCQDALTALERKFDLQSYLRTRAAATVINTCLGRWAEGIAEGKKAVEIGEQYGDAGATSFAAMVATWPYAFMGDLQQALELAELAVKRANSPADNLFAQGSRALVECRLGRAAQAAEGLAGLVSVIRSMRFPECERFSLYYCEALWRAGDLDRARVAMGECLAVVEPCGMRFFAAAAHRMLGEVELAAGGERLAVSARHFEESIALLEAVGAENELALAWAGYGRLRQKLGDAAAAREYSLRALRTFERLGTRLEPENIRHTLSELD